MLTILIAEIFHQARELGRTFSGQALVDTNFESYEALRGASDMLPGFMPMVLFLIILRSISVPLNPMPELKNFAKTWPQRSYSLMRWVEYSKGVRKVV